MIWHIITCEYPPDSGGVSGYTTLVAEGLAEAGDEVHVWAPEIGGRWAVGSGQTREGSLQKAETRPHEAEGRRQKTAVTVHRDFGTFRPSELRRVGKKLDEFPAPRRLFVQWVPHGYGYRSMNLPFCFWLWRRARLKGDRVELMVHEPYLPFAGSWKQHGAAVIHRLMTMVLLRSSSHIWLAIPAWKEKLTPYAFGKRLRFHWLPLPSNIPTVDDANGSAGVRASYAAEKDLLLGHYGTYAPAIFDFLLESLSVLLPKNDRLVMLLMGPGSERLRLRLIEADPDLTKRVHATGWLNLKDSAQHIAACDIMLQPYPDGVSSRRTTALAGVFLQLPTVTTVGELTEPVWRESNSVVLVPAGNVPAFVESVEQLSADKPARHRLSIACSKLYKDHFDLRHTVAALRDSAIA